VPNICKVAPASEKYHVEDVHAAGGIFTILGELDRAGLITRRPGVARTIELLIDPGSLPVLRLNQPVKTSVQRNYCGDNRGSFGSLKLERALVGAF